MGRILVLYDSATGHTKRMAELVAEGAGGVPGMEVRLRSIEEATGDDLLWCDGVAVGAPTNMGVLSWKMKRFWDETVGELWGRLDGKIGCAFASQGGLGGGAELTCQSLLLVLMNFGFLVFGVTDYVAKGVTLHYGAICAGEPRSPEMQDACRRLGERLADWVAVYADRREERHPVSRRKR
jgi:NAD(P)H dehydrogenase (quinone)